MTVLDDALAVIDHLSSRVTASTLTGLGCGAIYSTYRGLPIFKTSMSTAASFALVSTACFGMERVANIILCQSSAIILNSSNNDNDDDGKRIESNHVEDTSIHQPQHDIMYSQKKFHYQSHAIGGLLGGSVVSYLYHGKPTIGGVMLLTPIMLCIGKLELVLDGYKNDRLQQLRLVSEADNSDNVYHDDGKST